MSWWAPGFHHRGPGGERGFVDKIRGPYIYRHLKWDSGHDNEDFECPFDSSVTSVEESGPEGVVVWWIVSVVVECRRRQGPTGDALRTPSLP